MARVVDVRSSGGELVVLGGALTLPTSDNSVSIVLEGSLRYDAPSKSLQMFNGTVWAQATSGLAGGVASFNGRTGAVSLVTADITSALGFSPIDASTQPVVSGSRADSSSSGALASLLTALSDLGLIIDDSVP